MARSAPTATTSVAPSPWLAGAARSPVDVRRNGHLEASTLMPPRPGVAPSRPLQAQVGKPNRQNS